MTYIEVGAESAKHNGSLLLICEEKHLRLAWIVILENIMVLCGDLNDTITDVLVRHLFQDVSVQLFVATLVVSVWHWERWVDTIGGELSNALLLANLGPLITVNSANPQHLLLFDAKLFILASVHLRVLLYWKSSKTNNSVMIGVMRETLDCSLCH